MNVFDVWNNLTFRFDFAKFRLFIIPRHVSWNMAAERIAQALGISHVFRSSHDADQCLENRIDQDPANFACFDPRDLL